MKRIATLVLLFLATSAAFAREPLKLDPVNPHYFLFRGKPAVLVTSGEHYGAVLNLDFNYVPYLDELARNHLNLTRTFTGVYREVPGNFSIDHNTLAPQPGRFLGPWIEADGKFDLTKWNPNYFARLKDFLQEASKRGIVVELNLFCPFYDDSMWNVSPMNAKNNVNGIGNMARTEVYTLKHPDLLKIQDALVRKMVGETRGFDDLYFEICNEPYFGGVTLDWQRHISGVIVDAERASGTRQLISQNIGNGSMKVENPDPNVSIFNFHYSRPPESVAMNYALNRAIGNNETGFDGNADAIYRFQGWDFLIAGGALYNNLDYSFTAGHEHGDFAYKPTTPGGGSAALRAQLGILHQFMDGFNLAKMKPADSVIAGGVPEGASARVLAETGKQYAIYIHHGRVVKNAKPHYVVDASEHTAHLRLNLPAGSYRAAWLDTKTGRAIKQGAFKHAGGERTLDSPGYSEDIALEIRSANL